MSKRLRFLLLLVPLFLMVNITIGYFIYRNQYGFYRQWLSGLTSNCGNQVETTGYGFESDINYILFSDDISELFSNPEAKDQSIKRIHLFYVKYEKLIKNITIYDAGNNVLSIYKDRKDQFITDMYESQRQSPLFDKDRVEVRKEGVFFYQPVFRNDSVFANIIINLNIPGFISHQFRYYQFGPGFVQALLDTSGQLNAIYAGSENIIKENYRELSADITNDFDGFRWMSLRNGLFGRYYTSYYPVTFLRQTYAIVFSVSAFRVNGFLLFFLIVGLGLNLLAVWMANRLSRTARKPSGGIPEGWSFEGLFDKLPVGILLLDKDYKIAAINNTARCLLMVEDDDEIEGNDIARIALLAKEYHAKRSQSVFESSQLLTYTRDGTDIVLYRTEKPFKSQGRELMMNFLIDITDIEKTRRKATEASMAKSEFLATMSHEIRTPMNGVIGMADALLEHNLTTEQRENVEIIKKSAALLMTIINDILDFSKIEAGKMFLEEIPFSLKDELTYSVELYKTIATEKNIILNTNITAGVPDRLVGDPHRLRQIITNLVSNAVKFTPEGEIRISVKLEERYDQNLVLMFTVEDTGIGIPKNELPNIFGKYTQADLSVARKFGGTGLGTSICKRLVNLMNGEISVDSPSSISTNPKNPGSKFTFTIETYEDIRLSKQVDIGKVNTPGDFETFVLTHSGPMDDFLMPLRRQGLQFTMATSADALNEATDRVKIVLIEDSTTFDGFAKAEQIYKSGKYMHYLIIMLGRNDKHGNYIRSKKLGVDYYLVEPFEAYDLLKIYGEAFPAITDMLVLQRIRKDLKILVAEDNIINQKVVQTIFRNMGYEIDIARDGTEVVERVKAKSYDILFTDLMMPGKDGYEVARELRQAGLSLPIIAMTATATQKARKQALTDGMNDYITKPVEVKTIKNILLKWFAE